MQPHEFIASIKQYAADLQEELSRKDTILYLPLGATSFEEIARIAVEQGQSTEDPFVLFSIAKHGFALCKSANDFSRLAEYFPKWLYACLNIGAYEECIAFARACMESSHWKTLGRTPLGVALLRSYAKALRNLGKFDQALSAYRLSIERAAVLKLDIDKGIGLLLIGKLYGNYLGQQSLFSAFVGEARQMLYRNLQYSPGTAQERIVRHLAICHDALGQVYRETDPDLSIRHFTEAIRLNRRIRRSAGISRAVCHLNYLRFMAQPGSPKYLGWFQYGIRLLQEDPLEERGLGVRWIQYASMQNKLGNRGGAEECLALGKQIAVRYSDHKTIVRGCLVEAEICRSFDPTRALSVLLTGREVSTKYNLFLYESRINRELADLPVRSLPDGLEQVGLFERNREIHLHHIEEVKANLKRLQSASEDHKEFQLLPRRVRDDFRQRLLLDFERIVGELDSNVRALTKALSKSEDLRQELLIIGVMNSVARELVHEVKISLPVGTGKSSFEMIATAIDEVAESMQTLGKDSSWPANKTLEMSSLLAIQSAQVRNLGKNLVRLKTYLSNQLRRPRVLDEHVSLAWACQRALEELREQLSDACVITLSTIWDLEAISSKDLIVRVIKNLIRNAIEDVHSRKQTPATICISLDCASHEGAKNENPGGTIILSIMSHLNSERSASEAARALQGGLTGISSGKPFGAGVGLEMAQMVFGDLMGANLLGVANGCEVGIKVEFPAGSGRILAVSTT